MCRSTVRRFGSRRTAATRSKATTSERTSRAASRLGNNRGIVLESTPNLIGGDTEVERNVISGSTQENIRVDAGGNTIQGNYIGTDATGTTPLAPSEAPNSNGIFINGDNDTIIGGTAFGQGNLISGNGANGILFSGNGNIIRGNLIGTNAAGTAAVCNDDGRHRDRVGRRTATSSAGSTPALAT